MSLHYFKHIIKINTDFPSRIKITFLWVHVMSDVTAWLCFNCATGMLAGCNRLKQTDFNPLFTHRHVQVNMSRTIFMDGQLQV